MEVGVFCLGGLGVGRSVGGWVGVRAGGMGIDGMVPDGPEGGGIGWERGGGVEGGGGGIGWRAGGGG